MPRWGWRPRSKGEPPQNQGPLAVRHERTRADDARNGCEYFDDQEVDNEEEVETEAADDFEFYCSTPSPCVESRGFDLSAGPGP